MAKQIFSQHFFHPRLGEISIRRLASARQITARWKTPNLLMITVPPRLTIEKFNYALEQMMPTLLINRPTAQFFLPGWKYVTPERVFQVQIGNRAGYFYTELKKEGPIETLTINMSPNTDAAGTLQFNEFVNDVLKKYAKCYAPYYLLPMANRLAQSIGVKPRSISISHGKKVLGHCNARKEVSLSQNLIFYPEDVRRYVILHEFAHLTELNHSPSFYALVDQYLGHSHKPLKKAMNDHPLPFK